MKKYFFRIIIIFVLQIFVFSDLLYPLAIDYEIRLKQIAEEKITDIFLNPENFDFGEVDLGSVLNNLKFYSELQKDFESDVSKKDILDSFIYICYKQLKDKLQKNINDYSHILDKVGGFYKEQYQTLDKKGKHDADRVLYTVLSYINKYICASKPEYNLQEKRFNEFKDSFLENIGIRRLNFYRDGWDILINQTQEEEGSPERKGKKRKASLGIESPKLQYSPDRIKKKQEREKQKESRRQKKEEEQKEKDKKEELLKTRKHNLEVKESLLKEKYEKVKSFEEYKIKKIEQKKKQVAIKLKEELEIKQLVNNLRSGVDFLNKNRFIKYIPFFGSKIYLWCNSDLIEIIDILKKLDNLMLNDKFENELLLEKMSVEQKIIKILNLVPNDFFMNTDNGKNLFKDMIDILDKLTSKVEIPEIDDCIPISGDIEISEENLDGFIDNLYLILAGLLGHKNNDKLKRSIIRCLDYYNGDMADLFSKTISIKQVKDLSIDNLISILVDDYSSKLMDIRKSVDFIGEYIGDSLFLLKVGKDKEFYGQIIYDGTVYLYKSIHECEAFRRKDYKNELKEMRKNQLIGTGFVALLAGSSLYASYAMNRPYVIEELGKCSDKKCIEESKQCFLHEQGLDLGKEQIDSLCVAGNSGVALGVRKQYANNLFDDLSGLKLTVNSSEVLLNRIFDYLYVPDFQHSEAPVFRKFLLDKMYELQRIMDEKVSVRKIEGGFGVPTFSFEGDPKDIVENLKASEFLEAVSRKLKDFSETERHQFLIDMLGKGMDNLAKDAWKKIANSSEPVELRLKFLDGVIKQGQSLVELSGYNLGFINDLRVNFGEELEFLITSQNVSVEILDKIRDNWNMVEKIVTWDKIDVENLKIKLNSKMEDMNSVDGYVGVVEQSA